MSSEKNDSNEAYDVTILGAGPAGATAAILLGQSGKRVALVDRHTFPRNAPCAGWLNARSGPLLDELGLAAADRPGHVFTRVTFYNPDFTKSTDPQFEDAPGFLIDRTDFDNHLVTASKKAGVDLHFGRDVSAIEVQESATLVQRPGVEAIRSRLFVLATGRASPWLERLGFSRQTGVQAIWSGVVQTADAPRPSGDSRVVVVLGLDRQNSFAMAVLSGGEAAVTLNWYGDKPLARTAFVQLCQSLHHMEVVSVDLSEKAATTPIEFCPASFALDMDTHVGKNMVVIGDAGGFVSAASNEGIYPAMWSAQIAAGVLNEALDSPHPQDVLITYESKWRHAMADYLRSPNTDMQFLLPLIFSNQTMANRMAAAFFSGENL